MFRDMLNATMTPRKFSEGYWQEEELRVFCMHLGIPFSGEKKDLIEIITYFLHGKNRIRFANIEPERWYVLYPFNFTLSMLVPRGFRVSSEAMFFFKKHAGPNFGYYPDMQELVEACELLTFKDIIDYWRYAHSKEDSQIANGAADPEMKYSSFTLNYFADPNHLGHSFSDSLRAWQAANPALAQKKYGEEG